MIKKKTTITIIILITFIIGTFGTTAIANPNNANPYPDQTNANSPTNLYNFLSEFEMDFKEYIAMMNTFADDGEYLHFLSENESRYEAFMVGNPDIPFAKAIALVNVNFDKGSYSNIQEISDKYNVSHLVNHNFALPSGWTPSDLVDTGFGHMMREEAAEHFMPMRDSMREAGLNVHVIIAYRSYNQQRYAHNRAVNRYGSATADRNWARPGHSEHQAGLSVDLLHRAFDTSMHNARFQESTEFTWLTENAHNYGFILRYPNEHREFHRFVFEPWHWRFVGVEIATAMHNEGIALFEEFYGRYLATGVLSNVREHILAEQQAIADALAEAEELARIAEEEAAEAEELARIAAIEATEAAEAEELARTAEAEAAEAERLAQDELPATQTEDSDETNANNHALELDTLNSIKAGASFLTPIICILLGTIAIIRKKK